MEFQTNAYYTDFVSEFPDKQPPATSYPDPQKPGQMGPMNPTPEVPGSDAPAVETGSRINPQAHPDEEDVPDVETDN